MTGILGKNKARGAGPTLLNLGAATSNGAYLLEDACQGITNAGKVWLPRQEVKAS